LNASVKVLGDFEDDGHLDIATIDADGVRILSGDGQGGFVSSPVYAMPPVGSFRLLVSGDLDADGDQDLVAAGEGETDVYPLVNDGAGTFTAAAATPAGGIFGRVAAADVDGDGDADIVVGMNGPELRLLENDGAGAFMLASSAPLAGCYASMVVVADLDELTGEDLLAAGSCGDPPDPSLLHVFLGSDQPELMEAATFAAGRHIVDAAPAMFNGDAAVDIVVVNSDTADLSVLLGSGNAQWGTEMRVAGFVGRPVAADVGDFDGDGLDDLVVDTDELDFGGPNGVHIVLGAGDGTFMAPELLGDPQGRLPLAGDFNEDGIADIAYSAAVDGEPRLVVLLSDP
jgi:hypothetical protein